MFYVGVHHPSIPSRLSPGLPVMIARQSLCDRRDLTSVDLSSRPWVLDSGGFNEVTAYGLHRTSPVDYITQARRFRDAHPSTLRWIAPQDWMCEDLALKRTGLTVREHQVRTTRNFLDLIHLAPDLPIIPVLQGRTPDDYLRHVDDYLTHHIDLTALPIVGIGSVCRLQSTPLIRHVAEPLHRVGIRLHGFGVKTIGLRAFADLFVSADSAAWSRRARLNGHLACCLRPHSRRQQPFSPANCPGCAEAFYRDVSTLMKDPLT